MENVKPIVFKTYPFLQRDHQGFGKDFDVWLIDKTQASDPTKKEFYWMRTLKICILTALIVKVTISSLFRPMLTFTIMFGFPSTIGNFSQ